MLFEHAQETWEYHADAGTVERVCGTVLEAVETPSADALVAHWVTTTKGVKRDDFGGVGFTLWTSQLPAQLRALVPGRRRKVCIWIRELATVRVPMWDGGSRTQTVVLTTSGAPVDHPAPGGGFFTNTLTNGRATPVW